MRRHEIPAFAFSTSRARTNRSADRFGKNVSERWLSVGGYNWRGKRVQLLRTRSPPISIAEPDIATENSQLNIGTQVAAARTGLLGRACIILNIWNFIAAFF